MSLRLGIDTGGTYTDAVLMSEGKVISKSKSLTTRHNLVEGIRASMQQVLAVRDAADVSLVSLSTTLATNAIVEGHGARAALFLVGYQQSQLRLAHLNDATRDLPVVFIGGGHDAGGHEKEALDLQAAADELSRLDGVSAIAVSSMFSVRNPEHEIKLRELIRTTAGIPVSCGHELSAALDAPRRALTALINARLIPLIKDLINATESCLTQAGINAPLMVVRGDGSLVSAEFAQSSPVETILSGPAASVIGAQFLAQTDDMIVSDIGGTTTDVAMIVNGEPRLSVNGASVNGWRTMVRAVQIETHGLGGDSEIHYDRQQRRFSIGPHKVTPLCTLADRYPGIVQDLQGFVDEPWTKTNMAKFIVLRSDPGKLKLTAQQRALVEQVASHPQSMQSVFAERHFSLALKRLTETGVLTIAAFTPTDAAHVCGWYKHWDPAASVLGATLLSRYSRFNLGIEWPDEKSFCESMLAQVSRESAMCMTASAINEMNGAFGVALHPQQRTLLDQMFDGDLTQTTSLLSMRARLNRPVVGIGAPASSFYPPMTDYLDVDVLVPEHAEVANAIGAVVGVVKQSVQLTITPV
ncbi:MAG: hydantoinase/oxoprolinase family protein, partial [Pseudomonadota bacterium]